VDILANVEGNQGVVVSGEGMVYFPS
jgi:hypothetical protein